jgi:hypothetical protein
MKNTGTPQGNRLRTGLLLGLVVGMDGFDRYTTTPNTKLKTVEEKIKETIGNPDGNIIKLKASSTYGVIGNTKLRTSDVGKNLSEQDLLQELAPWPNEKDDSTNK